MMLELNLVVYADDSGKKKGNAYSFAIDVSGSMNRSDENRLIISLLKLFIDSCDEDDYISVTTYNDQIVFNSGPIKVSNVEDILNLKNVITDIVYSGDTDNGLGMLTAVNNLLQVENNVEHMYALLVSDGDTDIPAGSNRTKEDSDTDLLNCRELAANHGIVLNAVEYTEAYMQDTSLLSVVTSATGGGTTLVKTDEEFVTVVLNTFFLSLKNGKILFQLVDTGDLVGRIEYDLLETDKYNYDIVFFALDTLQSNEVYSNKNSNRNCKVGDRYITVKSEKDNDEKVTIVYGLSSASKYIVGCVKTEIEKEAEIVYIEKDTTYEETIQREITTHEETIQKEKNINWDIVRAYLIIGFICLATLLTCFFIIKKMLFKKKDIPVLAGYLDMVFIDIKSKNESKDIRWDLSNYPQEGVTLQELFKSINIKEEYDDIDKVCFYPSGKKNELLLVHCMEGGVFLGDKLIRKNTQCIIRDGEVIFFSFSENASELSITYHYS